MCAELTVASLNTLGIPRPGPRLTRRYAAIGDGFEACDADVVCLQEVLTWWHLRLLVMVTFRAEYLPAGETPHCIDFILTTATVKPTSAKLLFAGKEPFPGGPGYVSDHVGLFARLSLTS